MDHLCSDRRPAGSSRWLALALIILAGCRAPLVEPSRVALRAAAASAASSKTDGVLVSTGYWHIGLSKQGDQNTSDRVYSSCMDKVLSLNTSLVAYGDVASLAEIKLLRARVAPADAPKLLAAAPLGAEQLAPCAHHKAALTADPDKFMDGLNVPSVELGCIWDGKPWLLQRSMQEQPGFKWYVWLDICMGHGVVHFPHGAEPWPSAAALSMLPENKITVSYSGEYGCEDCRRGWYYCHCLAGTAFVVPHQLVEPFAQSFSRKLDECFAAFEGADDGAYICLSDQVILTKVLLDSPQSFFIGASGYGAVATQLLNGTAPPMAPAD